MANIAGTIDTTFGTNGKIVSVTDNGAFRGTLVQPDGKGLLADTPFNNGVSTFRISRYNTDGTLDSTFGANGRTTADFDQVSATGAFDSYLLSNGKIILAGVKNGKFTINQYNSNGVLDTTFGNGGRLVTSYDGYGLVQESNGKLFIAVNAKNTNGVTNFTIVRYNANGSLDTSFANGGTTTIDFAGNPSTGLVFINNQFLVVGSDNLNTKSIIRRYNINGSLDSTFGTNGSAETNTLPNRVIQQSDGKIVLLGTNSSGADLRITRFDANGIIDTTFGNNGQVPDIKISAGSAKIIQESSGKLLLSVTTPFTLGKNPDFSVTKYNTNGTLDSSFGTDGQVTVDFNNGGDFAYGIGLTSDGKIVVNGASNSAFAAVRLLNDASNPPIVSPPPVTPPPSTSIIPGVTLDKNLFTFIPSIKGFGVNAISQKPSSKVNEIVALEVDDATGKIGSLLPSTPDYLAAALGRAKPIFSTLGGEFLNKDVREVSIDPTKYYQFIQIQDASLADLKQQINSGKVPTNVIYALGDASSPIKVTENSSKNGYQVSINNDELILGISPLSGAAPKIPIASNLQNQAEGRLIDLTAYQDQTLKVDLVTKSNAAYNNNIGFYAVEDTAGTIKLADGTLLTTSNANYAIEAVKKAVLRATKTDSKVDQDVAGGKIYAPVMVSQGTLDDFITKNPTNAGGGEAIHAYFNYVGANPDKVDHFRLIGNNTFGVEDLYGGGDRDFNDLVINLNIKAPTGLV